MRQFHPTLCLYWQRGHYGPSTGFLTPGREKMVILLPAGESDWLTFYREGENLFVLNENRRLPYLGLNIFAPERIRYHGRPLGKAEVEPYDTRGMPFPPSCCGVDVYDWGHGGDLFLQGGEEIEECCGPRWADLREHTLIRRMSAHIDY